MSIKTNIYLDDEAFDTIAKINSQFEGEERLSEIKKYFTSRANYISRTTGWDFSRLAWAVYTDKVVVHGN